MNTTTLSTIIQYLEQHPQTTVKDIAAYLDVSKQYVSRLLNELEAKGIIEKFGATKGAYVVFTDVQGLAITSPDDATFMKEYPIEDLSEDDVFDDIQAHTICNDIPKNALSRLQYIVTEMVNNCIDHSQGTTVNVVAIRDVSRNTISCWITDNGIGVFANVEKQRKLNSELEALQDILKGKTTTDAEHHTGEGIFFSSKIADRFILRSHTIRQRMIDGETFAPTINEQFYDGTTVKFSIVCDSQRKIIDVFEQYTNDFAFDTSAITVQLYTVQSTFISRSEARRLLSGLEKFSHIILDFTNVETIGQGFADEIFRVWQRRYANIQIEYTNSSEPITFMIERAMR